MTTFIRAAAIMAAAGIVVGSAAAVSVAQGPPPGIRRIDLQRHDLSVPGREVVQVRVELDAGVVFGRHSHPGEEIVNVLEGSLEYQIDGKPPVTLEAGGVLFIPAGTIHAAKNVGRGNGAELATYIVEKGKPLVVMAAPAAGAANEDAIRPFRVDVPAADLADLKRRLAATRWPDKETVADRSQGAPLALLQDLVRHWGTSYDWRKAEAKLNAYPQFTTRIDGVDIHFIHVRSRHPNALPVLISHGWPGSVFEQIKLIGPLTDPTSFGGRAEDAFDVVIPSLPGYGFSARPTEAGWGLERIGQSFDVLMKRLGYSRYVAQGGDWGSGIVQAMARQAPAGLLGIHTNLPSVIPADVAAALGGGPLPEGLSEQERAVVDTLRASGRAGNRSYVQMMNARPQAVALWHDGLARRPRGLDARPPGLRALGVRQGSRAIADAGRRAGQLHAVLADQQRGIGGTDLLGEPRTGSPQCGRPAYKRNHRPGGHHGVSGRGLSRPGDVGQARVPKPDLLPPRRSRWPFCGLGASGGVRRRAPFRISHTAGHAVLLPSVTIMTTHQSALITGASSGLGAIYADRLARRGYDLILVARDESRLSALAGDISRNTGRSVKVAAADLTDAADLARIEGMLRTDSGIEILVNNAGTVLSGTVADSDPDRLESMIRLNVLAPTRLAAAIIPDSSRVGTAPSSTSRRRLPSHRNGSTAPTAGRRPMC